MPRSRRYSPTFRFPGGLGAVGHDGEVWAQGEPASCAAVVLGDFVSWRASRLGEDAQRLLSELPILDGRHDFIAIGGEAWFALLKARFSPAARRITRWAFAHEDTFDRGRLAQMTALPEGWRKPCLSPSTTPRSWPPPGAEISAPSSPTRRIFAPGDMGSPPASPERSLPASSYSVYPGGIEIEIDTRMDHRRKGLARALAAR